MKDYYSDLHYVKIGQAYLLFVTPVLKSFAEFRNSNKHIVISNFIARSATLLRGIIQLWQIGAFQDCWILHRCLMDRLFHLHYLIESNTFDEFEKWSFIQRFEKANQIRSDPYSRNQFDKDTLKVSQADSKRYKKLKKEDIKWSRPRPEDAAELLELKLLYKYGYDYASTLVHPMADDGEQEFNLIAGIGFRTDHPTVLNNSCLVSSMIVQLGLNGSDLLWRALIYDFIDQMRHALIDDSEDYMTSLDKILDANESFEWCKAK